MICIQNIYYMLSYAFKVLNEQSYRSIAVEEFDNAAELCAAILAKGISIQLKRGFHKVYIPHTDELSSPKGKIDISETVKKRTMLKKQLVCTYDDFSENSYMNQVIKTTVNLLMRSDISKTRKKELRKLMVFFENIDVLELGRINWNIQYNRNNQTYRMLIGICYLVVKSLLQTTSDGTLKMMDFLDEQRMCHLYEKFILEYYKKEFPQINVSSSQIDWAVDDGKKEMLPTMQSDIMLKYGKKVLIIDAKYYSRTTQEQYDKHTIHSANLYQIFSYVKNEAVKGGEVSGLLLYAKTNEEIQPDNVFHMSGNTIAVKTLDLNCEFSEIRRQLNEIAENFMTLD